MNDGRRKFLLCFQVGFLVGALAGCLTLAVLVSARIDRYQRLLVQYADALAEKDLRLNKLEEALNVSRQRKFIVQQIIVHLEHPGDEIEKIELEKFIKDQLRSTIGKEVNAIDPELLRLVIDGHSVDLGTRQYRLQLECVVLADTLSLWIVSLPSG